MSWIPDWPDDQVYIHDPQLNNYHIWRSLQYYVDPTSSEILELGTQLYPFKNIALAFLEILNFHSHSERSVQIYLKEGATHYLSQTQNYIVNMTEVAIDSYTNNIGDPQRAILYAVDYEVPVFSPDTVMNIVSDGTLNKDSMINKSEFTEIERNQVTSTDSNIYLIRSNLKINRVNVFRNIETDINKPTIFIKPLYLQEKTVTLTNSALRITGTILETTDPMSLHVEGVYIDFYSTMAGFTMQSQWNYPEANKTGLIYVSGELINVLFKNLL